MSGKTVRVAVIGGGIIGMSSALYAVENLPDIEVTIIAERLTPHTTGDGSAGFWSPYLVGEVHPSTYRFWCEETFNYLLTICRSTEAASCGIGFLSAYSVAEKELENPLYSDVFLNWRDLTEKELSMFPQRYKYGKFFTTIYAECTKLLPYMMNRFKEKGGRIIQRRVNSLSELIGRYDAVINCPGVEAFHIVPDPNVQPIRGQVMRVKAPWIKHAYISPEFYILPNSDVVICGGLRDAGNWDTTVNPRVRDQIWKGCCELMPSLKAAKVVEEWVGLRPGRFIPRIESETLRNKSGEYLEVVHNYGHGGSGVTLFWGCAQDAVKLLDESIAVVRRRRLSSNL